MRTDRAGSACLAMCSLVLPIAVGCGDDSGGSEQSDGTGASASGGSNSGSGGSSTSGGSGGTGGASGGANTGGAGAGAFPGIVDISDESFFGEDEATVRGIVQLPQELAANVGLQVGLASSVPSSPWVGNEIFGGRKLQAGTTFAFMIRNLDAGSYTVFARVDANESNAFESGDLGGYNAGTVQNPVLEPAGSSAVTVGALQTVDIEFGLGTIP